MAIKYNTSIVRSGLVLHLDAANTKSYKNYNLATYSQDFSNTIWNKTAGLITATGLLAPDGSYTAFTLTDADAAGYGNFNRGFTVPNDSASYNISIFIKKTTGGTSSRTGLNISFLNGTAKYYNIRFNADTGAATSGDSNLVTSETNDYWRLSFTVSNNSTGNTALNISYYPATGVYNGSDVATATGSHTVWGLQVTRGAALLPYKTNINDNADTWNDLSGNGNNGTLMNGVGYNSSNNGNIVFDGVNDWVDCGNASIFSPPLLTASIMVRCTSFSTRPHIFGRGSGVSGNFYIVVETNSTFRFYNDIGANWSIGATTPAFPLNTWTYVTVTHDGSFSKIYYNDVLQVSTSRVGTLRDWQSNTLQIGNIVNSGQVLNGNVGVAHLYNRALSATEVAQNFEAMRGRYGV